MKDNSKSHIRFLPAALNDLEEIWRYTAERWGIDQAVTCLDAIDQACDRLAASPQIASLRPEFSPPVRLFPQGSHLIVYLTDDKGIVVVRILHKSMHFETQLSE